MRHWRLYIDESGDHRYRQLDDLDSRYLGLTGVLIAKRYYDAGIPERLEALKKRHFRYDPDRPPVLVRSHIRGRKYAFGVLRESGRNDAWEADILNLFQGLRTQIFTVVMDKKAHLENYPLQTFDAYAYSLAVLLWRVRGYLQFSVGDVDVLAEARGKREDAGIQRTYELLRSRGVTEWGTPEGYSQAFPDEAIIFRKKEHNVAGLQLADLVAFGQKVLTVTEAEKPLARPPSDFTNRMNAAIQSKVNRYGRYMLG
jgi:hypothetical protein